MVTVRPRSSSSLWLLCKYYAAQNNKLFLEIHKIFYKRHVESEVLDVVKLRQNIPINGEEDGQFFPEDAE